MNGIIAFALRMRALTLAFFALVMIGGFIAFLRLNIEAYPDPVPPLVDIVTQNPGQSAEEIERYITIPIEVPVATAPYLTAMRIISLFGLSVASGFAISMGLLAGLYPSITASRLQPVEALRS